MKRKSVLLITNLTAQMKKTSSVSETLTTLLRDRGWVVYSASGKKNRLFRLLDMVHTTVINRKNFDVAFVEVYSGKAFIWAEVICILLKFLKKKVILGLFGGNLPVFMGKNAKRVKKIFSLADFVLSPSKFIIENIKPFAIQEIPEFHYGIDIKRFPFRLRGTPSPSLICLRGFHSIYNPWVPLQVVSKLKSDFPDIKLVMTGGDKRDGSLEKCLEVISQEGIQEKVKITGFIDPSELDSYVYESDILLNTPIIDNTPVSIIQAMASGLCIVSTNVGGLPYLIEDGVDGLLVPPNDVNAMALAIKGILTEPLLAEKLSRNARQKAESYDWKRILPQWEELFLSMITAQDDKS